jgi:hypothetical protein
MKVRISNFHYETGSFPLVEINMTKVHLTDTGEKITALTEHTVSSVKTVEGVEVVKVLNKYNHPFDYQGGHPFTEAMASLNAHLSDPTT